MKVACQSFAVFAEPVWDHTHVPGYEHGTRCQVYLANIADV